MILLDLKVSLVDFASKNLIVSDYIQIQFHGLYFGLPNLVNEYSTEVRELLIFMGNNFNQGLYIDSSLLGLQIH